MKAEKAASDVIKTLDGIKEFRVGFQMVVYVKATDKNEARQKAVLRARRAGGYEVMFHFAEEHVEVEE